MWLHARRSAVELIGDCRAIAATEFAVIVPLMLVMFFGTVEFSSALAVYRDVTLVARTLSDLTSQSTAVADSDLSDNFRAASYILAPYAATPMAATISELYVDPTSLQARVQWSRSGTINSSGTVVLGTGLAVSSIVAIPSQLAVAGTYLIFSQMSYLYTPSVGYVMNINGVTLSDVAYTRPRQSICVFYPTTPTPATCPTS
jgi:Flp pilus assembly protein TadG